MSASRIAVALVLALLLAACSSEVPASDPDDTSPAPATSTAPADPTETKPPSQPTPRRPLPEVLATPAPDGLQRVTFKAGDQVSAHGVYFLNASTGDGEGWIAPDSGYPHLGSNVSDDNRFAIVSAAEDGFLIDREDDSIWRWDPKQVWLLLAEPGGFLFAERDQSNGTGRYIWAGPDFQLRHAFDLSDYKGWHSAPLLSPDGERLALIHRGLSAEQQAITLLDLTSGDVQRVKLPAATRFGSATLQNQGTELHVKLLVTDSDRMADWYQVVLRYSWTGALLQEQRMPGNYVFESPDGKWVTWEEWPVGQLAPMTVVAEADSLKPHLQVLGATTCFAMAGGSGTRWLSDSSGLVLDTPDGYRLLTLDGELQEPPAFAGLTWKDEPQPSPEDPDRFALGRLAVTNSAGTHQLALALQNHVTPSSITPWGVTRSELRFALPPKPGHGACVERPPMPTQVQLPARELPEFPLVVRKADGCLALRSRPHSSGQVRGCLPDSTRLTPAIFETYRSTISWTDQSWWLSVETENGETGWLPLTRESVTWAAP